MTERPPEGFSHGLSVPWVVGITSSHNASQHGNAINLPLLHINHPCVVNVFHIWHMVRSVTFIVSSSNIMLVMLLSLCFLLCSHITAQIKGAICEICDCYIANVKLHRKSSLHTTLGKILQDEHQTLYREKLSISINAYLLACWN